MTYESFEGKMAEFDQEEFVIVHAAAAREATKGDRDFQSNLKLTRFALNMTEHLKVKLFVQISSCSVMGDLHDGLRDEGVTPTPDSKYGASKLACETMVKEWCQSSDISYTILRPPLIYGEHDRGAMAEIITRIQSSKWVLLGAGRNEKSFLFNRNLAHAIDLCINQVEKADGETFIVTDHQDQSIGNLSLQIGQELGIAEPRFRSVPRFVARLCMGILKNTGISFLVEFGFNIDRLMRNNTYSARKISKTLGYSPKYSMLDGVKAELNWLRSRS